MDRIKRIQYDAKRSSSILKKRCTNFFLLLGLILFVVALLYRFLVYASYLEVGEARFSDKGGSMTIHVETDAVLVSLQVHSGEWFTITQSGKNIIVDVEENKGAEDRQASITVLTGVIDDLCLLRKELTLTQSGKGATYLNITPNSIDVIGCEGKSVRVTITTDGDCWEVVSCPNWMSCTTEINDLIIKVEENKGGFREDAVEVMSYNVSDKLWISQREKPAPEPPVQPSQHTTWAKEGGRKEGGKNGSAPKDPVLNYPTRNYSAPNASSFTSFKVIDKELNANEADALLNAYPGWRFVAKEELKFIFNYYEYALPNVEEGYWCFERFEQGGGYVLSSLAYNLQGKYDSDLYRNRVVLVK